LQHLKLKCFFSYRYYFYFNQFKVSSKNHLKLILESANIVDVKISIGKVAVFQKKQQLLVTMSQKL